MARPRRLRRTVTSPVPRLRATAALLCLVPALAGCGGEPPAREPAAPPAATEVASAPADGRTDTASASAPASPPDSAAPIVPRQDTATVRSLTDGDRGCYLVLEDERGATFDRVGPFELCERRELVGRRVQLTLGPGEVLADSCQGNPECTERETVEVVRSAERIP